MGNNPRWKLVWQDEFDYEGHPDPAKWGYEEGFVRNSEKQYYTKERLKNARVENGLLIIEGHKEPYLGAEYTSASLITRDTVSWQFGRIEVRAKLPQGQGVWPAIWMMGVNRSEVGWPACGEIDIMEYVAHLPDLIHGTAHYLNHGVLETQSGNLQVPQPFNDFHVYAVEWFPDRLDFCLDDQKYHSIPIAYIENEGSNPFHKPFYLLINLALGGSWGGEIDDQIFPQQYLIDYVRVYKATE